MITQGDGNRRPRCGRGRRRAARPACRARRGAPRDDALAGLLAAFADEVDDGLAALLASRGGPSPPAGAGRRTCRLDRPRAAARRRAGAATDCAPPLSPWSWGDPVGEWGGGCRHRRPVRAVPRHRLGRRPVATTSRLPTPRRWRGCSASWSERAPRWPTATSTGASSGPDRGCAPGWQRPTSSATVSGPRSRPASPGWRRRWAGPRTARRPTRRTRGTPGAGPAVTPGREQHEGGRTAEHQDAGAPEHQGAGAAEHQGEPAAEHQEGDARGYRGVPARRARPAPENTKKATPRHTKKAESQPGSTAVSPDTEPPPATRTATGNGNGRAATSRTDPVPAGRHRSPPVAWGG